MLRNNEYRNMLMLLLLMVSIAGGITIWLSIQAAIIIILTGLIMIGIVIRYTSQRYRDIEHLSDYLKKIYNGNYTLDIRDNYEGELSILKNEIYKVTQILSRQADQKKTEKEQLANAISDISHQLKTPLTSMLVMTELLEHDELSSEKRIEFTRNIKHQLERMEWLLSSLLKLSKIDAGTVEFKKNRILVAELLSQSLQPLLIPIEIKEQNLILEGDKKAAFEGDLKWTAEAILNIVKNCIEHTRRGGTIQISYSDNTIYTEIKITDDGSGIAKEDLPFIFKRFYKGKNAGEESVGIGLAMAKSIITKQNGNIDVSSQLGIGTSFHIKFYKKIM